MELRQLKYFIKAAELQNFTNAAEALFITQSTLSQQIKQLEDELGLPLFNRIAKRVRLTDAGSTFLPYAIKTVKDAENGRDLLRDQMGLKTGSLTIGLTYGLAELLAKAIADFSAQYPAIKLTINFGTTQELLQEMELGKLDMMLSFYEQKENYMLITDHLFSSRLSLIVKSSDPIVKRKSVSLKELITLPLILPSGGYSIRNYFDKILRDQDLVLRPNMEVNDIHTLLQLVRFGRWVTVLMSSTVVNHPKLKAVRLTGAGMIRQATITWPKDAYRKKAASLLAESLKQHAFAYDDHAHK
ncbi:LysR substrate-binding domain-containing protein [Chryseolinea lacunae]|uniref:LysR family transcriptional regulator n=1 Tax=Chryseolinea lacunae TaxID=2801331 RepID=A0ABS1KR05_9BACT|nr:LysR substrate-binding domain-containing protein [Chryseolinea lacunae]MBL0740721.1 LysR family transcriptional regulator [Chryseolinea lacunae]